MTVHDWTRVDAGVFHVFQHAWVAAIVKALNSGLLPDDYHAGAEQAATESSPGFETFSSEASAAAKSPRDWGLMTAPPRVRYHARTKIDRFVGKANAVVVRRSRDQRVVARTEIVVPGNKSHSAALRSFVERVIDVLRSDVHLLVLDLLPPSPYDPQGIHKAIWDEFADNEFVLPVGLPLTLAAYTGGDFPEGFIEPTAVGSAPPDMPLFLEPPAYVPLPLEATYRAAVQSLPARWRETVEGRAAV